MASTVAAEAVETTADEFPSSMAIAIRTAPTVELASPAEIQRAMAQLDEQQFLADIMGEALEKWFYNFKVAGKQVEGVSVKGAHEFARLRSEQGFPIRFPMDGIRYEETVELGESGVRAIVIARDYRTGGEGIGVAFYPYMTDRNLKDSAGNITGTTKEFDRYAGRKAMSVAERNAILRLIPEKTIISALKVRARIVAENETTRKAQEQLAYASRAEAPRVTAGDEKSADPYTEKPVDIGGTPAKKQHPDGGPACPDCGGAMWDNREGKRNPSSPDFKCKNAPKGGQAGCPGVIWPPKNGEARDATGTRRTA